jgi:prevent-host-death family protein
MKTVQIRQAKAALSAVVAAAERGQPTLITRHGQPSAMVVPVKEGRRLYPQTAPSFADYLLAMPRGPRIAVARDTTPLRDVRL